MLNNTLPFYSSYSSILPTHPILLSFLLILFFSLPIHLILLPSYLSYSSRLPTHPILLHLLPILFLSLPTYPILLSFLLTLFFSYYPSYFSLLPTHPFLLSFLLILLLSLTTHPILLFLTTYPSCITFYKYTYIDAFPPPFTYIQYSFYTTLSRPACIYIYPTFWASPPSHFLFFSKTNKFTIFYVYMYCIHTNLELLFSLFFFLFNFLSPNKVSYSQRKLETYLVKTKLVKLKKGIV